MADIEMVVTDLDGTFLDNNSEIPPINIKAFTAASQAGLKLVFATGRPSRWVDILQPLAFLDPLVLISNGAAIYDIHHKKVLQTFPIPASTALTVAQELREKIPHILFGAEYPYDWAFEQGFTAFAKSSTAHKVKNIEQLFDGFEVLKLLAYAQKVHSDDLGQICTQIAGNRVTPTWSEVSNNGFVEISAAGVSKGSTLAYLAENLAIDLAKVLAFGDMPNDYDMLCRVGFPFAMAGGHDMLTDQFPSAGDNHHGGVGKTLLNLL